MTDQAFAATDSPEATTIPQGTVETGNDQTGATTDAGSQPAQPTLDEGFLKTLESLDPASLPQSFNEKFVPKAEFTKKTQALAEDRKRFEAERQAIFELARKALSDRQQPTGPTPEDVKRKELMDLAAAGDATALQQLVRLEAESLVQPIRTQQTLQNAAQNARAANPAVSKHWDEIVGTIQNDPSLKELASINNYQFADKVMIALGIEHQNREMAAMLQQREQELTAMKGKLAQYEKERTASLPSSTSRAGVTAGRPAPGDANSIHEAGLRAWIESGGRPEDYR